jgi:hypothetical protein
MPNAQCLCLLTDLVKINKTETVFSAYKPEDLLAESLFIKAADCCGAIL